MASDRVVPVIAVREGLEGRAARLEAILADMGSVLVAYSGGVDSAYLLLAAHRVLGSGAAGLLAVSPSLPAAEHEAALQVAAEIGARLEVVEAFEHMNPEYVANNPNRCYFCKTELFDVAGPVAERLGLAHVAYGANRDDLGDFRPGMQAARERAIRAPLLEADLDKADIRLLAREAGLSIWDKPAFACLASRIPHGTPVTTERLARVERAEVVLREAGFRQFRVRDLGRCARVEVDPVDVSRLLSEPWRGRVTAGLLGAGFDDVEIDPEGYRPGKLHGTKGVA
ncbi:MAG TPA: ATP-dependent sacrificial sulfur transferase LarE [Candidatus Eisenbacteria bacterium]